MRLVNPYLDYFLALPASCRRDVAIPVDDRELRSPEWLAFKAAVAAYYSWAVPTHEAIAAVARRTTRVIDLGAGSGYWAWLLAQMGVDVIAFDATPPPVAWYPVLTGNELAVPRHSDRTLFLCWPPWASPMARNALALYSGDEVVYVGEWYGGSADAAFYTLLSTRFEQVEEVSLPQWFMRSDRLTIHQRK